MKYTTTIEWLDIDETKFSMFSLSKLIYDFLESQKLNPQSVITRNNENKTQREFVK